MKRSVALLAIALLVALAACAPASQRVLGESSHTYLLQPALFDRQAEFVIKDVTGPTLGRIVRKMLVLTPTFEIRGKVFDLNYDIYRQDVRVAHVSKRSWHATIS